ncbi:sensor histidine kinase [Streptomyces monomycini]|uniref:sensor histidine kinase n=1 Tax=Streptomyces monomycini TaxID=371720 RepID=UPI0009963BBA|nr:sensor histidine kinase [Streptomyces monomycini]
MGGVAGEVRRRVRRVPPLTLDAGIAAGFATVSLLLGHDNVPAGWERLDGLGSALTCLVNLLVVARRQAPVTVCLTVFLLWSGYIALDYWPVVNSLAGLMALYTVAAHRPPRVAAGCSVLLAVIWNFAGLTGEESSWATTLGQSVLYPVILCWFGNVARTSAERNVRLAEMAGQLRREQEENARRAVAEERVRIARELHDVVAHHMSVISVQAGLAGYVFTSDPETARRALGTIAGTSGEALEEMRRLLAVLRVDPREMAGGPAAADRRGTGEGETADAYEPAPGLDRIGAVVARVRAAGLPAVLRTTGERRPYPPGLEQCAYRVVQEALTNALKHAGAARVEVRIDHGADRLTVEVRDDGGTHEAPGAAGTPGVSGTADTSGSPETPGASGAPTPRIPPRGAPAPPPAPSTSGQLSTGNGLIGMRERARIYGGSLRAGPVPGGGFQVLLTLPVHPAAGPAPPRKGTTEHDQGAGGR